MFEFLDRLPELLAGNVYLLAGVSGALLLVLVAASFGLRRSARKRSTAREPATSVADEEKIGQAASPPPRNRRLGDGYEPHVDEDGGALIYSLPVDSGIVSVGFSFEITQSDLDVLQTDSYRRAVLEVVAHTILQRSMLRGHDEIKQVEFDQILNNVLHSSSEELEEYISRVSRDHNIAIRYYVNDVLARRSAQKD
jgi:hypothetical protein